MNYTKRQKLINLAFRVTLASQMYERYALYKDREGFNEELYDEYGKNVDACIERLVEWVKDGR